MQVESSILQERWLNDKIDTKHAHQANYLSAAYSLAVNATSAFCQKSIAMVQLKRDPECTAAIQFFKKIFGRQSAIDVLADIS